MSSLEHIIVPVTAVSHLNARITKVLVTHGHADHAGAVRATAAHCEVPIIGPHADDLFWIESLKEQGARFGLTTARPFVPDPWLKDGDHVQLGKRVLQGD
jgi:hydroxyacylglutathione hydrolase